MRGDLSTEAGCLRVDRRDRGKHGRIDILINNIAYQHPVERFEDLTSDQLERTFRTNVFSYFWCTKARCRTCTRASAIINTGSINGLRGNKTLIDYAATKGAVHAFTYSMAQALRIEGFA